VRHPPNYFCQTPETPEPVNKFIFYDADRQRAKNVIYPG
jgi:hypothetical protein